MFVIMTLENLPCPLFFVKILLTITDLMLLNAEAL